MRWWLPVSYTHLDVYKRQEVEDMLFANTIVKNSKSNALVLAKNNQLLASGVGQTSRVDALKQAIEKAKSFEFCLLYTSETVGRCG